MLLWRYQIMDCFVKLNWFCAINDWYGTIVIMHVALPQVVRGSFRLPWLEPIPKFKWRCSKRHLWLNCFKRSSFQETRTFGFWLSKVSVIWVSHKDPFCRLSQVRWELSQPMREDVGYTRSVFSHWLSFSRDYRLYRKRTLTPMTCTYGCCDVTMMTHRC